MAKKTTSAIKSIYKLTLLGMLGVLGFILQTRGNTAIEQAHADVPVTDTNTGGGTEGGVSGADSGTGVGGDAGAAGDGPTGD